MLRALFRGVLPPLSVCALALCGSSYAASFTTSLSSYWSSSNTGTWNPKANDNVIAVKSDSIEYYDFQSYLLSYTRPFTEMHEGTASAAAFGSDTSGGNGLLDPRMLGYAVEPMAFAAASAGQACTLDGKAASCYKWGGATAAAGASVVHRIVQRESPDIAPEVQAILDTLGQVRVKLDYSMDAQAPNANTTYPSTAEANFSVTHDGKLLISRKTCAGSASGGCTSIGKDNGSWTAMLERSTTGLVSTYTIYAGARVSVLDTHLPPPGGSNQAQSVADPFLYLDPAWEYASYFMVQQESTLHPGEWVEVTRLWQQPVPEPGTFAIMLTGLVVGGLASRRRVSPRTSRNPP